MTPASDRTADVDGARRDRLLDEMKYWRDRAHENSLTWFQLVIGLAGTFVGGVTFSLNQQLAARTVIATVFCIATPIVVGYFNLVDALSSHARSRLRELDAEWVLANFDRHGVFRRPLLLPQSPPGIWPVFVLLVTTYTCLDIAASLYAARGLTDPATYAALGVPFSGLRPTVSAAVITAVGAINLALLGVMIHRSARDRRATGDA